jgi:hypothetical protein
MWIRIRMDPHHFVNLDPHQIKILIRIWIRIKMICLFEHFFKGLSFYLEAGIRIRIRVISRNPDPHLDPHQGDADP